MRYLMRLANGDSIQIDGFGVPFYTIGTYTSKIEALSDWAKLTPEALREVEIADENSGAVILSVTDAALDSVIYNVAGDAIVAQFQMHGNAAGGSSAEDADYIEAAKILLGEEE